MAYFRTPSPRLGVSTVSLMATIVALIGCDGPIEPTPSQSPTIATVPVADASETPSLGDISPSDEMLLDEIQRATFGYFWDFAHPDCGMARERSSASQRDVITTGGSGFGILSILTAAERQWIPRDKALGRLEQIVGFLEKADRFHGAWPHWLDGRTGKVIPFSPKDDGADLVETAYLIQGLLTAREYFEGQSDRARNLRRRIDQLWQTVEWNWFTQGQNVLFWHWSPAYGFEMNHRIEGWNECLIVYVLAASSPTHPIDPKVYHAGWARNGKIVNDKPYRNILIPLGRPEGGPLFFAHYSFLSLDPRGLNDRYANYWEQNVNHSRANYAYCVEEAKPEHGYSDRCWGLTASDNPWGYAAHEPGDRDNGTITPSAALSSMPYTPVESIRAARFFRESLGQRLWGPYGFRDAFSLGQDWFAEDYLAIDQGPIIVMIENYRTGLIWNTFMKCDEVRGGLKRLGFATPRK
ncbi:MAG TPA: beta-glucosidase [Planctomycetaceae bacterium]|nr:beta-glucosidase [Planctomycetaceae bacterium]